MRESVADFLKLIVLLVVGVLGLVAATGAIGGALVALRDFWRLLFG